MEAGTLRFDAETGHWRTCLHVVTRWLGSGTWGLSGLETDHSEHGLHPSSQTTNPSPEGPAFLPALVPSGPSLTVRR